MIDPRTVTFTTDNVHIPDSYRYRRQEVRTFLTEAKPKHPSCLPLQKRSMYSLLCEWATHKAAYLLDFKRDRTASVDLNYPQRWWVKLLYFVCGSVALLLEAISDIFVVLLVACALVLPGACSVVRPGTGVPLPQIVHDTVYHNTVRVDTVREVKHFRDTVVQRDSVYVEGQTVYKERYIYKTRTAHDTVQVYRYLRDTMYVHRRDSISVPVYIDRVEKVRYVPGFTKVLAWAGGLSIIALILWLLFLYLKRKF